MGDTLRNLGSSEIFTLILGRKRKHLYVARPILEQIPFFSKALKGDQYKEAKDKVFEMLEDDPKPVADLLHFVLADHVKPLKGSSKIDAGYEDIEEVEEYVRAYIVADKLMAEQTANRIMDRLFNYHLHHDVEPELFGILREADFVESQLWEYLMDTFVGQMRKAIKDGKELNPQRTGDTSDENDLFDDMTKDDAIELLKRLTTRGGEEPGVSWKKCDLHTHEFTPACPGKAK